MTGVPMTDTWAIVLAGGEGSRLQSLVRLVHEEPLPKQFATLVGSRSLLQTTIERVRALAPPDRTMVVVSRGQEALARRQLADWKDIEIVAQPENRGTALGILLCCPDRDRPRGHRCRGRGRRVRRPGKLGLRARRRSR